MIKIEQFTALISIFTLVLYQFTTEISSLFIILTILSFLCCIKTKEFSWLFATLMWSLNFVLSLN